MSYKRAYSRYTLAALSLLGKQIELARKTKRVTTQALAERCGITRVTLRKIERGEPTTEIGFAFEAAAILGVELFEAESVGPLNLDINATKNRVALLPKSVRRPKIKVSDDF